MDRIKDTFQRLAAQKEKALVGFVTAGDPDPGTSKKIVSAMCRSGLDILELGVPFSDPTADGPVIQRSSERALKKGTTLSTVLDMTADLRKETDVPVILFSYYNPIFSYGVESFYSAAVDAGADGVLVVDLPPEESDELTACWTGKGFSLIRLVAPTTPPERVAVITAAASGFVYLVSMTGVTGSAGLQTDPIADLCARVKKTTTLPVCVGFGISTVDDVARVSRAADGVVIGSAFERLIEENLDNPGLPELLAERVRQYKAATKA
jgi:tryptophan synthase alpha chain